MNGTIEQPRSCTVGFEVPECASDEQLLLEYRSRGDRKAFETLVHRYEKELYGYLRHYLGDAEAAKDVFQQTFLQVHLKCAQFDAERKVRPWLYAVATNQAIDYQRRNQRHRMVSLDDRRRARPEDDSVALVKTLEGSEPGPQTQTESAERCEQVRRAVAELPEPARQVVILVYFRGLKYREAAEVLDIPVGTVKSRLHAAIGKLSEALNHTTRLPR